MPQYRVKQCFGRDGRKFNVGEIVEVEKSFAAEVPKALEAIADPEAPVPPPGKKRRGWRQKK